MKDIKYIPNISVNHGKAKITSPGENLNVRPVEHGTSFRALVHGGNDFKNVPYDTFPNSSSVLLLSKEGSSRGYGSATFIAPRVILTCAHNFYNDDGTMKNKDFYYIQGHNSETNPDATSGVETQIDKSKIQRFSSTYTPVSGTDFCVAIVDTPCEFSYSDGTHTNIDNPSSNRDDSPISIIGYPYPNDVPQVSSKMKHGFLYESKGKISQTFNDGTMIYDIDTLPGNSGSGVISNNKLVGVHIGAATYNLKNGGQKEYNLCVNIDNDHYNWLKKIIDENKTTGWYDYEDNKYYYDENQELVKNKKIVIDGTYYVFDENGVLTDQGVDETPDNNAGTDTGTSTGDTTGGIDEAPSVDPTRNLTGDIYDHDERNTQSFRGNNYTHFVFFANTPLTNMSKYMNFGSNQARDEFFDTVYGKYKVLDISQRNFNMVRDRLTVNITYEFDRGTFNNERSFIDNMIGVNYCYFYDENTKKRFYCQVVKTEYVNDAVTKFYLAMDVLTTFFQGDFSRNIGTVHIIRQHLPKAKYKENLYLLASRDKLQCSPPRVIKQFYFKLGASGTKDKNKDGATVYKEEMSNLYVVFQSSVDLSSEFGNIDEPKMKTSGGTIVDYVTSPVDVYAMRLTEANKYFDVLGDYPWIEQNIKNINIIPRDFIDDKMLENVDYKIGSPGLKKFKDKSRSKLDTEDKLQSINVPFVNAANFIQKSFKLGSHFTEEKHLFNSGYFKYFCTNWSGAQVELQPEKLPDGDLKWGVKTILGYDNKIMFFPRLYNNDRENLYYEQGTEMKSSSKFQIDVPRGEYMGAALIFNSWDTLPVLIDNYKMSLANSAYDRKLSEENRLGNQFNNFMQDPFSQKGLYGGMNTLGTVFGGAGSAMTAGFTAGGLGGGLLSGGLAVGGNLLGNWKSEYEYYRNQKAQFDQMKIQRPTETTQTLGNAFAYKNGTFGVSVKLYAVTQEDYLRALRYHKSVGYQWDTYSKLDSVTTMSHVNYVQFDGDWIMGEIPSEFQQVAKQLFREGVSVYHNPNRIADPFSDDILNNKRVK